MVVTESQDDSIGAAVDQRQVIAWLRQAAATTGLSLQLHPIDRQSTRGAWLRQHLSTLKPGPEDVVVFYYSGHGSLRCSGESRPVFSMPGNFCFGQASIHQLLLSQAPRLLITIFDCCTERAYMEPPLRSLEPGTLIPRQQQNLRALWLGYRGDLRIQSNDPQFGPFSYGNDEFGGLFTDTFLAAYRRTLGGDTTACTWDSILYQTRSNVRRFAQLDRKVQVPSYAIELRPIQMSLRKK
ncbi:MAG: hypothetical protein OHK0039_47860 [Bacteroidia bacterium]